jgi:two-component system nitrogen regulation response regulator GlnG
LLALLDAAERPGPTGRAPDVRVVASSGDEARERAREGRVREDLFLRLAVATLRLPPLRDRLDDVPDLARAFLFRTQRDGQGGKTLDSSALERMARHAWPGNVRELENLMRRVSALYTENLITDRLIDRELQEETRAAPAAEGRATLEDLIEQSLAGQFGAGGELPGPGLYDRTLESIERPLIRLTLGATRGNQIKAAEVLGINRNTLRKKIEVLGVEVGRRRS